MAAQANAGPRNPEEWLERLSEIVPDVEKQRELKNNFCQIREGTITELTKVKDRLTAINKGKNCVDIGSAGFTLISSFLAVVGQICSLSDLVKPDVYKLMVEGGKRGSLFGIFFSLGSKAANKTAEWRNAKTVRSILEEDGKSSMALMGSLIGLEELKKIVEEVMSFDMFTRMINFFKRKRNVDVEEVNANLPPQICYFIRSSSISKSRKAKVEEWMTAIYRSSPSRNSFFNVMLFIKVLSLCKQYQSISEKCRDVDVESEFITKLEKCISILQEELNIIRSLNLD